jgi:hypothetical protein
MSLETIVTFGLKSQGAGSSHLEPEVRDVSQHNTFPAPALKRIAQDSGGEVFDLVSKNPRELIRALIARGARDTC